MPRHHPPASRLALVGALLVALVAGACEARADATPQAGAASPVAGADATATPLPVTTLPGHEVYGFVPYWEMDDGIAAHVRGTQLTTLALFSVTNTAKGAINTKQNGYRRIAGGVGKRLVRDAHDRGIRVELVFSSFGLERNARFFEDAELQDETIASLVELVGELGVDGLNADVEALDLFLVPAYGAFIGRLRDAIVEADATDQVSVATTANAGGAAMAAAAASAGADRVFVMGYDYHYSSSSPGASAPLDRRDGSEKDLTWSLDLYRAIGVPPERTILGLPLYGMSWPVAGPVVGAPEVGKGEAWIPRRNLDVLRDASIVPIHDEIEGVEVYLFASDGSIGPPSLPAGSASIGVVEDRDWQAVYVDSPATLSLKLALANDRGLAGAGFWAIGYERGLPGFTDLIARFAAGEPMD